MTIFFIALAEKRKEAHMKRILRRKNVVVAEMICLALTLSFSEAFSWRFATHAYIDGHLVHGSCH
jgi:hypothetical protein